MPRRAHDAMSPRARFADRKLPRARTQARVCLPGSGLERDGAGAAKRRRHCVEWPLTARPSPRLTEGLTRPLVGNYLSYCNRLPPQYRTEGVSCHRALVSRDTHAAMTTCNKRCSLSP